MCRASCPSNSRQQKNSSRREEILSQARKPWVQLPSAPKPRRGDTPRAPVAPTDSTTATTPTASILLADITDFSHLVPAHTIDFAFNLINSIRHLDDDAPMLAHFEQMARVLKPGAVYALGLGLASYGIEMPTEDIWLGRRGTCEVRQCVQYLPAHNGRGKHTRKERCINHLTVTRPSGTEEIDFVYDLRTYDLKQWMRLISRSALQITRAVDEQGNQIKATEPGYAIFLLQAR